MTLIAWIAFSVVLVLATYSRPYIPVTLALILWLAVPGVAGSLLTGSEGGLLTLHPSSWLVLVDFALVAISGNLTVPRGERRTVPGWVLVLIALLAIGWLGNYVAVGVRGVNLFIDLLAAPALWFALVLVFAGRRPATKRIILTATVAMATANALVALAQYATKSVIFFGSQYATLYWFKEPLDRSIGLMDSPTGLGMLMSLAIPFLAVYKRFAIKIPLAILFSLAAISTQSRVSLVLAVGGIVYLVFAGRFTFGRFLAGVTLIGLSAFVVNSGIVSGVASRFADDSNSTELRTVAFNYFASHVGEVLFVGHGFGAGVALRTEGVLDSSLENGYVIYAYDLGLGFAALFIIFQILMALRVDGRWNGGVGAVTAGSAMVSAFSFSSIGASGSSSALTWLGVLGGAFALSAYVPTVEVAERRTAEAPWEYPTRSKGPLRPSRVRSAGSTDR